MFGFDDDDDEDDELLHQEDDDDDDVQLDMNQLRPTFQRRFRFEREVYPQPQLFRRLDALARFMLTWFTRLGDRPICIALTLVRHGPFSKLVIAANNQDQLTVPDIRRCLAAIGRLPSAAPLSRQVRSDRTRVQQKLRSDGWLTAPLAKAGEFPRLRIDARKLKAEFNRAGSPFYRWDLLPPQMVIVPVADPYTHAELRLLQWLYENDRHRMIAPANGMSLGPAPYQHYYLGISLLCCPLCFYVIDSFNDFSRRFQVHVRGHHLNLTENWRLTRDGVLPSFRDFLARGIDPIGTLARFNRVGRFRRGFHQGHDFSDSD